MLINLMHRWQRKIQFSVLAAMSGLNSIMLLSIQWLLQPASTRHKIADSSHQELFDQLTLSSQKEYRQLGKWGPYLHYKIWAQSSAPWYKNMNVVHICFKNLFSDTALSKIYSQTSPAHAQQQTIKYFKVCWQDWLVTCDCCSCESMGLFIMRTLCSWARICRAWACWRRSAEDGRPGSDEDDDDGGGVIICCMAADIIIGFSDNICCSIGDIAGIWGAATDDGDEVGRRGGGSSDGLVVIVSEDGMLTWFLISVSPVILVSTAR